MHHKRQVRLIPELTVIQISRSPQSPEELQHLQRPDVSSRSSRNAPPERQREIETKRYTETDWDRQRHRQTETERDRDTEREEETERDRDKERGPNKERNTWGVKCHAFNLWMHSIYGIEKNLRFASDILSLPIRRTRLSIVGSCPFSALGPSTWNDLPLPLQRKPSLVSIKPSIKTFHFRKQ